MAGAVVTSKGPSFTRAAAGSWFVVLPDCDAVGAVAGALRSRCGIEIPHPSGRPWVLGSWPQGVGVIGRAQDACVAVGRAQDACVAVVGQHAVTSEKLAVAARRLRSVGDIGGLARSLPGSFHLIASAGGRVAIQGTISSHRQVFCARIGGVTVAADRAHVLAELAGAALDEQRLAVCLLDPAALHPLTGQPLWRGITAVPLAHHVELEADGRHRVVRSWWPPDPVVPMAEGAPVYGEVLSAAVEARVAGRRTVSADLGGLDSTSVCCLAACHATNVLAYTITNDDPADDELVWARRTVAGTRGLEHHVIPALDMPITYDGLLGLDVPPDEPCIATVDLARFLVIPRLAAGRGSEVHLTGFGGDDLLSGSPAHLRRMLRTRPKIALSHLRGFAAKGRWSYREALRQLAEHRPYRSWLATVADDLTAPAVAADPGLGWGRAPRLPTWVTPGCAQTVGDLIRTEAQTAMPHADDRGFHVELEMAGSRLAHRQPARRRGR